MSGQEPLEPEPGAPVVVPLPGGETAPPAAPGRPAWLAALGGPVLLAVVGASLVAWTWMAWPDAISDTGRELYLAWQLAEGKVLYRDVAHFNGPLSAYADALWFRLFPTSLRSLVVADLLVLAALAALIYRGAQFLGGKVAAFSACLVFLAVFAVGPLIPMGSFSYLAPYSHELTHGALLLFLLLLALVRYLQVGGRLPAALAGLALGLLLLTKVEIGLAGLAAAAVGLGLAAAARGSAAARELPAFALGALVAPLIAWALLASAMPPSSALRGVLGAWSFALDPELAAMPYFRIGQGTYDLVASLRRLAFWSLAWLAAFGVPWLAARWIGRLRGGGRAAAGTALLAFAGGALVFHRYVNWLEAARPLPVALLGLLALDVRSLGQAWRDAARRERAILRITLAVLSLVMLTRMFLFARVWHYGFVLAMPGTLLLVAVVMGPVPAAIQARGGDGWLFRAAAGALLLAAVLGHVAMIGRVLEGKTVFVGSGADRFRADGRGRAVAATLRFLDETAPPGRSLAVLPDGVILNFLSRRPNPTPYVIGNPADMRIFGEQRVLEAYRAAPPDYLALVHCDTAVYGYRFFGQDYAQRLGSWIASSYEAVGRAGALPFTGDEFGILLLERDLARGAPSGSDPGSRPPAGGARPRVRRAPPRGPRPLAAARSGSDPRSTAPRR